LNSFHQICQFGCKCVICGDMKTFQELRGAGPSKVSATLVRRDVPEPSRGEYWGHGTEHGHPAVRAAVHQHWRPVEGTLATQVRPSVVLDLRVLVSTGFIDTGMHCAIHIEKASAWFSKTLSLFVVVCEIVMCRCCSPQNSAGSPHLSLCL
jgi:hypothetical protein